MKRVAARFRQILLGTTGAVALFTPTVLLAAWSAAYLRGFWNEALAPGRPLVYKYVGQGGVVEVRAGAFTIDPETQTVVAQEVSITAPGVNELKARRLYVVRKPTGALEIDVFGVVAPIERLASGKFDLERLLPEQKGPEGPDIPFQVKVHGAYLALKDSTLRPSTTLQLTTQNLAILGMGDDFELHGDLAIERSGPGRIDFEVQGGHVYDLKLGQTRVNLDRVVPMAKRYLTEADKKAIGEFGIASSSVSGNLRFQGTFGGWSWVTGRTQGTLTGLTVGEFVRRESLTAEVRWNGDSVTGSLGTRFGPVTGAADWSKGLRSAARFDLKVPSLAALPDAVRRSLPQGIALAGATINGGLVADSSTWAVSGKFSASDARMQGETLRNLGGQFLANGKLVALRELRADWQGLKVQGAADIDPVKNQVTGFGSASHASLGPLLRRYGIAELTGTADLQAIVKGPLNKPGLELSAMGTARYARKELNGPIAGVFEARLSGSPDKLEVNRAVLRSPDGVLAADGSVVPGSALELRLMGTGLRLARLSDQVTGEGTLLGTLTGLPSSPKFSADIEAFRVRAGGVSLPYAKFNASLHNDELRVSKATVEFGISKAEGSGTVNLKTGKMQGLFSADGVPLADLLPGQAAFGFVKVAEGRLGGTLKEPSYSASVSSGPLAIGKTWASGMAAKVEGDQGQSRLTSGVLMFSDALDFDQDPDLRAREALAALDDRLLKPGSAHLSGLFNHKDQSGNVTAELQQVPLRPLYRGDKAVEFGGTGSGAAELQFGSKGVTNAKVSLDFEKLLLNGGTVGTGNVSVTAQNGVWKGSGAVGQLGMEPRYVEVQEFTLDPEKQSANAKLYALNLRTESLVRLAGKTLDDADPETKRILFGLSALLNAEATLNWSKEQLDFTVAQGELADIQFGGRQDGGKIALKGFRKQNDEYAVDELAWTTENGFVRAAGNFNSKTDQIRAQLEAQNVDLGWALAFNPKAKVIPGELDDAYLDLSGTTKDPEARGSFTLRGLEKAIAQGGQIPTPESGPEPASILFYDAVLKGNKVSAQHTFQAFGFAGSGEFTADTRAFQSSDKPREADEKFEFTATANKRPLADFAAHATFLDFEKSDGELGATAKIAGTLEQIDVTAEALLTGKRLALKGVDTSLENPMLQIRASGGQVEMFGTGISSAGGSATLRAGFPQPDRIEGTLQEWLEQTLVSPESGIEFNGFRFEQRDVKLGTKHLVTLNTAQPITITGKLAAPLIAGTVKLDGLDSDVPNLVGGPAGAAPPIDPFFNLIVETGGLATVRAGPTQLTTKGSTVIGGRFTSPTIAGAMTIEGGVLKLPNARIVLEEGGRIEFGYRSLPGGSTLLQAPIDMTGRTSITAKSRTSNSYERYDISLFITGDLMSTQPLQIRAVSDPGDLSEQEILALVGQQDLIQSLESIAQDVRGEQLRETLFTYALPQLTEGLTRSLAGAFDLDYLALEYNPFEGPTFVGAKTMDRFTSIQARRLVPLYQKFRDFWELKLVYRVPSRNALLSRTRFSLGTGTGRSIRLAIEYSIRF